MNTSIYAQATAVTALLGVVTSALMAPLTAQAQDSGAGGIQTRLGVSQTISANRNATLAAANEDTSLQAQTTLNYNISSQTRTETLNLNAVGVLRGDWLEGTDLSDSDVTFTPRVTLNYDRQGATSAFSMNASATRSEIAYSNTLADFLDADGNLVLPRDFDDLSGTGTRQSINFATRLRLRDDAPFGITLDVGYSDLSYSNVTSATLNDSRAANFGITGRFDINDTTQARLGLRYRAFDDADDGYSDQLGLTGGITFSQPAGTLGLSFSLTESDGGVRTGFEVSRALDLPGGRVSGSVGLSRSADDDILTTGNLVWTHELKRGVVTGQVGRSVSTGSDDTENVVTSLSVGTSYALSPTGTLNISAGYVESEQTTDGATTGLTDLGISYAYTLNDDWSLSAGASYRNRTSTGTADAESSSLSLTLNRVFEARR